MKIALYIEDGLEQIVVTGESETEKSLPAKLSADDRELTIKQGGFYHCQGGWTRQTSAFGMPSVFGSSDRSARAPDSTIIVLQRKDADPSHPVARGGVA